VVAVLPATLEPNTLYKVRTGAGYDEFLTDSTGSTAHPLRWRFAYRESQAGRFQMRTNDTWASDSDDNFGFNDDTYGEQAGGGTTPIQEWEHQGVPIRAGSTLRSFDLYGRGNNTQIVDLDLYLSFRTPDSPARWETGIDNDAEMSNTLIMRDLWMNPTDPAQPAFAGNVNDIHRRRYPDLNFVAPADGWLSLYVKATGNVTANRYFIVTKSYLIEELL